MDDNSVTHIAPITEGLFGLSNNDRPSPPSQQEVQRPRNLNDLDTPAYLRQNIVLEEPQAGVEISKISLEEDKDNKSLRFKDNGNKYLHDNVD
jgi:hypothetical protein